MKRHLSYFIAVIMFLAVMLTSYTNEMNITKPMKMTMTTNKSGIVGIGLAGIGTAVIDWGDKSNPQTITLSDSSVVFHGHVYTSTKVRTITVSGVKITSLDCYDNQITSLEVSNNTELIDLSCNDNHLKSLNVSKNKALTFLSCEYNQLTNLDVSKNKALKHLLCFNNQLMILDVSNNKWLTYLWCGGNQLKSLDVSKNTILERLYCESNQLSVSALNTLFETLHDNVIQDVTKTIIIGDNPGTDNCSSNIAKEKGWLVNIEFDFIEN